MNSDKKVGILTFSYSSNPGSVLQAYALQKKISEINGCTASIINYQKTHAGKPILGKTVFYKPIRKWHPKKVIEWTLRIIAHPIRMRKYEKFFNKYYNNYPTKICGRNNLKALENEYDIFVVGSDQVWNLDSYNVDYTYFLDFVSNSHKKISYAASFGQSGVPERERKNAAKFISDFTSISVREENGIETVSQLTGKQAEWVLDPSLLLDKKDYNMAIPTMKNRYVFLYLREDSSRLEEFACKLAELHNLQVVKVLKHWRCNKKGHPFSALGPLEWLGLMQNADFIVTNSFHGICFSIIFEKEFYVDLLKNNSSITNPRIESLLKQFELTSRNIDAVENFESLEKIDYKTVNEIKLNRKNESLNYLKKAIDGEQ